LLKTKIYEFVTVSLYKSRAVTGGMGNPPLITKLRNERNGFHAIQELPPPSIQKLSILGRYKSN